MSRLNSHLCILYYSSYTLLILLGKSQLTPKPSRTTTHKIPPVNSTLDTLIARGQNGPSRHSTLNPSTIAGIVSVARLLCSSLASYMVWFACVAWCSCDIYWRLDFPAIDHCEMEMSFTYIWCIWFQGPETFSLTVASESLASLFESAMALE